MAPLTTDQATSLQGAGDVVRTKANEPGVADGGQEYTTPPQSAPTQPAGGRTVPGDSSEADVTEALEGLDEDVVQALTGG